MKLSVAITTYNGSRFIAKQLESINNQTVPVDEVIIHDDGSTDKTVEIVRDYIAENGLSHWHLFINDANVGYCQNFYNAIDKCTHEIIFLSDQDDLWDENKTAAMLAVFAKHKHITAIASSFDVCDPSDQIITRRVPNNRSKNDGSLETITLESLIGANTIRGCTMAFRKSIVVNEALPVFHSGLLGHDWIINVLAAIKGDNVFLNRKLMRYRVHDTNTSFSPDSGLKKKSTLEIRILGLEEQLSALDVLSERSDISASDRRQIAYHRSMTYKRLRLLRERSVIHWLFLMPYFKHYAKIYGSVIGGVRVYLGDYVYSEKKQRK